MDSSWKFLTIWWMNLSAVVWRKFGEKKSPPEIFNGLDEVVRELSASNTIGIITGNSSENVKAFLVAHGLDGCVRAIYGVDSPGSKAEKISLAQNQFAAKGEAVFMVGDSASDVHAAKEASRQKYRSQLGTSKR